MTSFKEISVEDYKKLLNNRQHTFAKTFKNTELLQNFERSKNKNTIDNILKEENQIKKEDDYIEKLSNKISNKLQPKSNELIEDDNKKRYLLNASDFYNNNPKMILATIKNVYLKSNFPYEDIYIPRAKTKYVHLDTIVKKINSNNNIPDEMKYKFVHTYNNIVNKTSIKYSREIYEEYVLKPIREYYVQDEDRYESLKDKLKSDISKTTIKSVVGEGIFDKIKIDKDLLKKNILKVRYIKSGRKLNNKLLREDYKFLII